MELWCAPDTTHPWFAAQAKRCGLRLAPQQGQSLGERMHNALADAVGRYGQAILTGLRHAHPKLFQGIAWSTGVVRKARRSRLRSLGLGWAEFPTHRDLDRSEDLGRLRLDSRLACLVEGIPALEEPRGGPRFRWDPA